MPFDNPHDSPFGDLEVLRAARSHISDKGHWLKADFQDGDRLCLVAALSVAAGSRNFCIPNPVEQRLARILAAQLPPTAPLLTRIRVYPVRRRLMFFNDDAQTLHEDVLAVFDRAINHLAHKTTECAFV
jgi:hypothetical protein